MYCASCGVAVAQGLSYCNYCGAKLNETGDSFIKSSEVKPETLVAAMVFVFVFGLGAITVLMGVMKAVIHLDVGQILGIAMLSFLIMLLLEGVFVWQLARRPRRAKEPAGIERPKERTTNELDAARERLLPEPVPSVTEHTTRAFEPIYQKQSDELT